MTTPISEFEDFLIISSQIRTALEHSDHINFLLLMPACASTDIYIMVRVILEQSHLTATHLIVSFALK